LSHNQSTKQPSTTAEQRKAAALFYKKKLNGFEQDWVDTGVPVSLDSIDPDVVDLSLLLARREQELRVTLASEMTAKLLTFVNGWPIPLVIDTESREP